MSVINYQNLFEVQKHKEEEKGQVTIILTPDLSVPAQDLMIRHRVKFDQIFHSKNRFDIISNAIEMKGSVTIFYKLNNEHKAVLFIQSEVLPYKPDHRYHGINEAYKYTFLIHGLAHVNDFGNRINFNEQSEPIDAIKVEAYAAVYTLKYLTVNSYAIARALYASRLLELSHSGGDCSLQIQREVMKKYPKKKLLQWSKQL